MRGQPTYAGHMGNGIHWDQDLAPPESDTVINGVCGLIEGQLRQQTGPPGMILMDVTLARSA